MWRMIFLILVVLGALAVLLAVLLGIGVAKVAMVQSADLVPTSAPLTTQPASKPTLPTTLAATTLAATAPMLPPAQDEPDPKPQVVVPPVVAKVEKPADYVPGTIILRAASAKLGGNVRRKTPLEADLANETRYVAHASWVFTPPEGKYRIFLTHANGADKAGEFAVALTESRKVEPEFLASAKPTGGWDVFRSEYIGTLDFQEKRTTLVIRPPADLAEPLMRLRQVELIPVVPMPTPKDDNEAIEVMGLTLVEAATGKPLGLLTSRMVVDLATLPPFSVRAETAGPVRSVRFTLDKKDLVIESEPPFSIVRDGGDKKFFPWNPPPGRYTLTVTPYPEPVGGGKAGPKRVYYLHFASSSPVVLPAQDAKLYGDTIRVERGDLSTILSWSRKQDWVEWTANVPRRGQYTVELLYACAKGHGGKFVLRAGDEKLAGEVGSTDGAYDSKTIGVVKLKDGKNTIAIKPSELNDDKSLMDLREVRLVPVIEANDD